MAAKWSESVFENAVADAFAEGTSFRFRHWGGGHHGETDIMERGGPHDPFPFLRMTMHMLEARSENVDIGITFYVPGTGDDPYWLLKRTFPRTQLVAGVKAVAAEWNKAAMIKGA